MTSSHQLMAAMHAVKSLSDPDAQDLDPVAGAEVVAHARRRTFSDADKRRILAAAGCCTKPGEIAP